MILDRSYFYPSKIMLTSVLLVNKSVLGSTQTQYILHKKIQTIHLVKFFMNITKIALIIFTINLGESCGTTP